MGFHFPAEVVSEGKAEVVVPRLEAFMEKPSDYAPSKAPVFYNPVMELNRDLAVLALQVFQHLVREELTVCEPLAGCGIRGVRLALEVEGVARVVVNDINREAYRLARFNVEKNELLRKVKVANEDANFLLSRFAVPRMRFSYIDIDPFGSPMPYVDSAVRALQKTSVLALTATDLASLCGVYPNACKRKYGGKPLRTEYCHELAVRLLGGALVRSASKYDVGIKPVFSHSSRHYVRVYAIVDYGARKADESLESMGLIWHCFNCLHREASPGILNSHNDACPECGSKMDFAGPLWIGRIVNDEFVASLDKEARNRDFKLKKEIRGLLILAKEEANAPITYYTLDKICDKLSIPMPSVKKIIAKLEKLGHRVSLTHFNSRGFKTDASAEVVKNVVRECARNL